MPSSFTILSFSNALVRRTETLGSMTCLNFCVPPLPVLVHTREKVGPDTRVASSQYRRDTGSSTCWLFTRLSVQ